MTDRDARFSPLTALGDGLLLLCAVVGFTLSLLSLYGGERLDEFIATPISPLDLCAIHPGLLLGPAVLFALASLCAWSLPRFRWAAAGGLTVLWGLLVFFNWDRAVQGGAVTVRVITDLFTRRVSWGRSFAYESGLTPSQEGGAARLFLVLALALLALVLGWAVIRARRWWLAVLFTLPPLLPGLLADLYPDWPPFLALAACWCVMLLTDLCKWAAPDRRGLLTLAMLPCVGLALAVITFAFPREGYTRPDWALRAEVRLSDAGIRLADFFAQFDGPFHNTVTYVGAAEEADLAHAGPLNYSGRTVLRVTSDCPDRLYLRGSSLALYGGGVWRAMPQDVYQEYLDQAGEDAGSPLVFPALTVMSEDVLERPYGLYTATVVDMGTAGSCVYTPYFLFPLQEDELGMLPVEDAYFARRQGQREHTMTFAQFDPAQGLFPENIPRPDFAAYQDYVYDNYLYIPAQLDRHALNQFCADNGVYGIVLHGYGSFQTSSQSVQTNQGTAVLLDKLSEYKGPIQVAQDIAALLDELCEYDPETPAAPEGEDPVLYFLNDSRRGYCMHFASAAALMLRSLGIPARYVSGFTVVPQPGRTVDVPDRAAHAWVEVWVDGFGWYPVEVTPPAAFEWYQQGELTPIDLPSDPVEESDDPEPTPTPSDTLDPSDAPSQPQGGDREGPAGGLDLTLPIRIAKALTAAVGAAALVWLGQYLPKRFRAKKLSGPDRNRAALDGYGYLKRMERWGGRVDERAVELAQKAKFSPHTLTGEELDELRALVDRERERLCVVLGPVQRLAFRYLWGMPRRPRPPEPEQPPEKPE